MRPSSLQVDHDELMRRSRWINEKGLQRTEKESYQQLRSKSPKGSPRSPCLSNEDQKIDEVASTRGARLRHDDSFNSQANKDQKSLRAMQEKRGRQMAVGGDRSNVNDILNNFNREKEQFNSKLQDLKNKLRTLSFSP